MKEFPWFGDPWPCPTNRAPVCEDDDHMDTPVGALCVLCEEQIREGDRGTFTSSIRRAPGDDAAIEPVEGPATVGAAFVVVREAMHAECQLRMTVGGAGHLASPSHRSGGCGDPDGGLTYRQSALLVWQWAHAMGTENLLGAHRFPRVVEELQRLLAERRKQLAEDGGGSAGV